MYVHAAHSNSYVVRINEYYKLRVADKNTVIRDITLQPLDGQHVAVQLRVER